MRSRVGGIGICLTIVGLGVSAPTDVLAQDGDEWALGSWKGTLVAGPSELEIVYHITRADDGSLTGTMDVPTQGAVGIPLNTVVVEDGKLTTTFAVPGGGSYEGTRTDSGDALEGTFTQAGQSFPMNVERTEGASEPPLRPQEPKAPFPYVVSDVAFANASAGIELSGTLTLPEGSGPFPAVALVSGSGPQDRNETLLGHKPFLVLADHLTRAGIAVLRYDDRGVGESGGTFATATSEDFATDALAAVSFLAAREEIDAGRVGIAGHSEGGLIAPMAAVRSDAVAFIVLLAGPAVPGIDILVAQGELINRAAGSPEEIIELNSRIQRSLSDIAEAEPDAEVAAPLMASAMRAAISTLSPEMKEMAGENLGDAAIQQTVQQFNSPWFRYFLHYDPRPALAQVTVPILALNGEKDLQVPVELNLPEMDRIFQASGHSDATTVAMPGLNHLFQEAKTGAPAEYQSIEQTFAPEALERVSSWILERFGRPITD